MKPEIMAPCSSEVLVSTYKSIWCHHSEYHNLKMVTILHRADIKYRENKKYADSLHSNGKMWVHKIRQKEKWTAGIRNWKE
jgi:hypothetical protein